MKPWLLLATKLLITLTLLSVIFHYFPVSSVIAVLKTADIQYLLLVAGLGVSQICLSAARLTILTDWQGLRAKYRDVVRINFISMYYGTLLPGTLVGGVVRWHRLYKIDKQGAQALAAVVFARIISTVVLLSTGLFFVLFDSVRAFSHLLIPVVLCILFGLFLIYLLSLLPRTYPFKGRKKPGNWGPGFRKVFVWVTDKLSELIERCARFRQLPLKSLVTVLLVSCLEHLVGILLFYLIACSVGAEISFAAMAWLRMVVALALLLPTSVSGLGVREGVLVLLLEPYNVAGNLALAISLLIFAKSLFIAFIGGLIEFSDWSKRPRNR